MEITYNEKTKIIVRVDTVVVGSITNRGKEYRFKAHQGISLPNLKSESLEDLKNQIQKEAEKEVQHD